MTEAAVVSSEMYGSKYRKIIDGLSIHYIIVVVHGIMKSTIAMDLHVIERTCTLETP